MAGTIADLLTYCDLDCDVKSSLVALNRHLGYFESQVRKVIGNKIKVNQSVAPYIGRAFLEGGFTALLFRVDHFRATTLLNFQNHVEFDHSRQQVVSISWTGDILPSGEANPDLWQPKVKPDTISRALLSKYSESVSWLPAITRAKDEVDKLGITFEFPTIFDIDPAHAIGRVRGEARQLYSFWSKGIHCEFFAMQSAVLDDVTCIEKMKRTYDIVADMALLSQFSPVPVGSMSPSRAMNIYQKMKAAIYA